MQSFNPNDRSAILAAIHSPDQGTPIARAIKERVRGLMAKFNDEIERVGAIPTTITLPKPETALDAIATDRVKEAIAHETGINMKIRWKH